MQRRFLAALIALVLTAPLVAACADKSDPQAANDIRIYQVLPVARNSKLVTADGQGEMIALVNTGTKARTFSGWQVTTTAGKVVLPKLTMDAGQIIYLADDVEYFKKYWNFAPSFEYGEDTDKAVPDLKVPDGKIPVLKDDHDVVRLLDDKSKVVDILAYGNITNPPAPWNGPAVQFVNSFPLTPPNQVLTRLHQGNAYRLESRAESWSNGTQTNPERVYMAGQSDFPVKTVSGPMTITAASAPDNAGPLLFGYVERAKKSIRMVGYQFNNKELAERLVAAAKRGVRVQVGIERNPSGSDMFDSDKEAQEILAKGGVEVLYYYKWDGDLSTAFNPVHSKYVIIDDETALVSSGNYINSVYSNNPTCGNREWMAAFSDNADVVKLFREVWDFDFGSGSVDVRPYNDKLDRPTQPDTYDAGPCYPYTPVKTEPFTYSGKATVTRILSPDNTMDREKGFLGVIHGAKKELLISANYIYKWWGAAGDEANFTKYPQPYLTEIVDAARRGVDVKVIFDRKVTYTDKRANHYVVQYLNDLAAKEKLKLEARLVNADGAGIGRTYHNKSLIVDDAVVVSSINGSENSFRYARELAIKIDEAPQITNYFRDLFMADWNASAKPGMPADLKATPRNDGTFLDWSPNPELDVTKYEIYHKPNAAAADWTKITTVTQPGYTDSHDSGIWGVVAVNKKEMKSNYAQVNR